MTVDLFLKLLLDCTEICIIRIDILFRHLPDEELEKRDEIVREFLSSIFVKIVEGGYGTRAHSVILVDYDWNVEYMEIAMEQPIDPRNPTWIANNITVSV